MKAGFVASGLVVAALLGVIQIGPGVDQLARLVFAGTATRADRILAGWSDYDRLCIAFANGLDYLFGLLLFGSVALAISLSTDVAGTPSARKRLLIWSCGAAIVLDVPENTAYLLMVLGDTGAPWPLLSLLSTVPRFATLIASTIYLCRAFSAARAT